MSEMQPVKNLFDYLNMFKKEEPVKQTVTTTTSSINGTTFIPPRLSVDDVCKLAKKYFDGLSEEELNEIFEKFKSEYVNGKTLLKAGEDNEYLKKLKEKLGLTEKRNSECFDKMVDVIRQRQKELSKNFPEQRAENIAGSSKDGTGKTKDNRTVGAKLQKDKLSTTKLEDINVEKKGSDKEGTIGLDLKSTDYADLSAGKIVVKVDNTKSVPKKRPARRNKSKFKRKKIH